MTSSTSIGSWCFPSCLVVGNVFSVTRTTRLSYSLSRQEPSIRGVTVLTYQPTDRVPSSRCVETFAWTGEQTKSWQAAQNADRVLATVLFTDIVGSTAHAAAVGDQQWRRLIDRHDQVARAEVDRFRGNFVKATGDGILATFDAPTRALRCAFGLNDAFADLGLGDPIGHTYWRDRNARRRRRRDRCPYRGASSGSGWGLSSYRHTNRARTCHGHRPCVRFARLGRSERNPWRVGAVRGLGQMSSTRFCPKY